MLLYWNRSFLRLIIQRSGSVFLRPDNVLFGLFLAAMAAGLQFLIDRDGGFSESTGLRLPLPELPHHYAMHALGVIVAFATVFRTNLGWQRYWESITQLHFMYSKWADAYTQFYAFAQVTIAQTRAKGGDGSAAKIDRVLHAMFQVEKHFTMLSAMATDRLSHGDTQRMEKRATMGIWHKQIVDRTQLRNEDLTGFRDLPKFTERKCNSRETAEQSVDTLWHMSYVVKAEPTPKEEAALKKSTDRVNMVMYWIVHAIAEVSKDIDTAPPIQSRMYQELSNGMLGFSNAVKIADVPFPLPYAQLLTLLLLVYVIFIPVYVQLFTKSYYAGPLLTFLLFEGIWGVNEVAKELENPFGADVNDISVADFHARFLDNLEEVHDGDDAIRLDRDEDPVRTPSMASIRATMAAPKSPKPPEIEIELKQPAASKIGAEQLTSAAPPVDNICIISKTEELSSALEEGKAAHNGLPPDQCMNGDSRKGSAGDADRRTSPRHRTEGHSSVLDWRRSAAPQPSKKSHRT